MTNLKFRKLRADEIDARVAQINVKGLSLLLYKDARCDMRLLDETVGPMNWMRQHSRDNANCTVSIWDTEKNQWISKEDTGTESNTEAEKGLASDSFKRACFNWGIGRELYSAPFIWIPAGNYIAEQDQKGKWKTYDRFRVDSIGYDEDGNINALTISNTKTRKKVYEFGAPAAHREPETQKANNSAPKAEKPRETAQAQPQAAFEEDPDKVMIGEVHWISLKAACRDAGMDPTELLERYQVEKPSQVSLRMFKDMMNFLDTKKKDFEQTGLPFETPE